MKRLLAAVLLVAGFNGLAQTYYYGNTFIVYNNSGQALYNVAIGSSGGGCASIPSSWQSQTFGIGEQRSYTGGDAWMQSGVPVVAVDKTVWVWACAQCQAGDSKTYYLYLGGAPAQVNHYCADVKYVNVSMTTTHVTGRKNGTIIPQEVNIAIPPGGTYELHGCQTNGALSFSIDLLREDGSVATNYSGITTNWTDSATSPGTPPSNAPYSGLGDLPPGVAGSLDGIFPPGSTDTAGMLASLYRAIQQAMASLHADIVSVATAVGTNGGGGSVGPIYVTVNNTNQISLTEYETNLFQLQITNLIHLTNAVFVTATNATDLNGLSNMLDGDLNRLLFALTNHGDSGGMTVSNATVDALQVITNLIAYGNRTRDGISNLFSATVPTVTGISNLVWDSDRTLSSISNLTAVSGNTLVGISNIVSGLTNGLTENQFTNGLVKWSDNLTSLGKAGLSNAAVAWSANHASRVLTATGAVASAMSDFQSGVAGSVGGSVEGDAIGESVDILDINLGVGGGENTRLRLNVDNPSILGVGTVARTLLVWLVVFGFYAQCVYWASQCLETMSVAPQGTTAGDSVMGTNFNSVSAFLMAILIVGAIAAGPSIMMGVIDTLTSNAAGASLSAVRPSSVRSLLGSKAYLLLVRVFPVGVWLTVALNYPIARVAISRICLTVTSFIRVTTGV